MGAIKGIVKSTHKASKKECTKPSVPIERKGNTGKKGRVKSTGKGKKKSIQEKL